MKFLNKLILFIATALSLFALTPGLASAIDSKNAIQCGVNAAAGTNDCKEKPTDDLDATIKKVINILSVLIGVVAVVMIMVGGFRYITSAGNQESIKNARNTLLYAVVGLVVVALAQVIAAFVLNATDTSTSSTPSTPSTSSTSSTSPNANRSNADAARRGNIPE